MISFQQTRLDRLVLHGVGNRSQEEGVRIAKQPLELNDELRAALMGYFLGSFKGEEWFRFDHETDLSMNEVYTYCTYIFENPDDFYEQSVHILRHLYEQSNHTKIQGGELYVAYWKDMLLGDELVEAVGIFKTEHKDTYLKLHWDEEQEWSLHCEEGTNLSKLDKGCLVFNSQAQEGLRVLTVDAKTGDAKYWRDSFLRITGVQDQSYHTKSYLQLCKSFVKEALQEEEKNEQVDFLNRSLDYFDTKETFDYEEFKSEVFEDENQSFLFDDYKQQYEESRGILADEPFEIAPSAVKKMRRSFRNVIQLDTQIEIKIHSSRTQAEGNLERGFEEERGMHYYKVFFNEES